MYLKQIFNDLGKRFSHIVIAEIVGMTSVGGTVAADIGGIKIGEAIYEVYVLIALRLRAQIGVFDDTHTLFIDLGIGIVIYEIPVGLGSHDNGRGRLFCAEALVACVMRFFQMLCVGCVVIVIVNENAHFLIRDKVKDRGFAERAAAEAEIIYVRVEHTGDLRGVVHTRSACTNTVHNGGAVEQNGRFVGIRAARFNFRALAESDVEVFHGGVDREVENDVLHDGRCLQTAFHIIFALSLRGDEGAFVNMLAVLDEIHFEARRSEHGHRACAFLMGKVGVNDDDIGGGTEAYARARSHRVQTGDGCARLLCDLLGNATERLIEAVQLETRSRANVKVNGGTHGCVRKDGSHFSCNLHGF